MGMRHAPDTVDHVHPTLARALAGGMAAAALSVPAAVTLTAVPGPASAAAAATPVAHVPVTAARGRLPATPAGSTTVAAPAPVTARTANAGGSPARHVVVVGIGGLRWSDISPTGTPALWRLAGQGSIGSLIVRGARARTCPADDWLTLNAAARAAIPGPPAGPCPPSPRVVAQSAAGSGPGSPVPARVPAMAHLVSENGRYSQNPQWGLLGTAAGPGRCATAVGPGSALALATSSGRVATYLPSAARLSRADLARCSLTVIDLGNLPPSARPGGLAARAVTLRAADRRLATLGRELPRGTVLMVAGSGDGSAHLRAIIVWGPGYRAGLLSASSTRQPGMVVITDLTPTILRWLAAPVPPVVVGSQLRSTSRDGLPATVSMLTGQDTAAQVYQSTMAPFFLVVGFGYALLFALIGLVPWGRRGDGRRRRRRRLARAAGVWAAAVPAGTFLAGLVPWWAYAHPAAVLYSLAAGWAAVVAVLALTGPWRRDPLGPVGVVGTVTLGVIALDLVTGSHLQLEAPFGLGVLVAGRFYGLGNNAVVIYATSGILCAAWLAGIALRKGRHRQALAVMAAVLALTVVAGGWPGFGAKVGGTIAMVPGFLVLLIATARVQITVRRALLIGGSGVALVAVFALINYAVPATGHSDVGGFVGQALHGGAVSILRRKITSNFGSLAENPFVLVIPVVVAALGLAVFWPTRVGAHLLAHAYAQVPLLRPALSAVWLVAVLGWFAEDSGVTVPAAALPMVLPVAIVILSSVPARGGRPAGGGQPAPPGPGDPVLPRGRTAAARSRPTGAGRSPSVPARAPEGER